MSKEILLDVRHLTQQFHLTKKIKVKAVDDVSFQIHKGEIFGLVGESGSGKSTVARCLMNIYHLAAGLQHFFMLFEFLFVADIYIFIPENEGVRYYYGTNENPAYHTSERKLCEGSCFSDGICRT